MRSFRPAVLALVLLAALTGCTAPTSTPSGGPTATRTVTASAAPTGTTTVTAPPASAAPAPSASGGSSSGTTAAADPNRPADQCADSVLKLTLSMPKGAAGSFVQDIDFTNTGSSSCVLRGAPGLSVVGDGAGTQLGAAASRDQAVTKDVRLAAHGGQAYALFGGTELGKGTEGANRCTGGVRSGDGYRVYPPHSTRAVFLKDADAVACPTGGQFLHVASVLPVGTAG